MDKLLVEHRRVGSAGGRMNQQAWGRAQVISGEILWQQRAGRAGRLGPGYCLRLWTKNEHHGLLPFHPPEIVSIDLAELAMELALWGVQDPAELRWLTPPRQGFAA